MKPGGVIDPVPLVTIGHIVLLEQKHIEGIRISSDIFNEIP